MNAREYFEVTACSRPTHKHWFGPVLVAWQIADDKWVHITDHDTEVTHWFRIGKVRNMSGQTLYELVIGRLLIMVGFDK